VSACAIQIAPTPLEGWIAKRIGLSQPALTREALEQFQLKALHETVAWARSHSSHYARRLANLPHDPLPSLREISRLPLTTPEDLTDNAHEFLCVPQDEISRIVTLRSSGTGGAAGRASLT